jgi:hypothetical protein
MHNSKKDEIEQYLRNERDGKVPKTSKRIGQRKFSPSNSFNMFLNGDESNYRSAMTILRPTPVREEMREESSSSMPRRISWNGQDGHNDVLEKLINTQSRITKKTVRFAPQPSMNVNRGSHQRNSVKPWEGGLTEDHCHELWYQKQELATIKHEAKVVIANRNKILKKKTTNVSSEERESWVGLERFSKQRGMWKKSGLRCILLAQRQMDGFDAQITDNILSKEEYIRDISLKCTAWSRDAAQKQGFHDYCAVHDPLASLFSDKEFNSSEISLEDYTREEEQNYNEMIFGETTDDSTSNKRAVGAVYDDSDGQDQVHSDRSIRQRTSLSLLPVI